MSAFRDKVVLVTGGTSGIGRATALAYAKAGAKVAVSGRRSEEGQQTVALIKEAGAQGLFIKADVTSEADVKAMVEKTVSTFGRLDIAFNNAGIELVGPVTEVTEADYRKTFDINVLGVLLSLKYEIPAMLKAGGGAIVNTSSVAGVIGMAGVSVYCGTKHAVIGITKAVALEYATKGIRINAIAPAAIQTDMLNRFTGGEGSDFHKQLGGMHPVGRVGRVDEVAAAVLWLTSPEGTFVTGQTLPVDGGYTIQ